jgi:cell division protein FtsB
LEARKEIRTLEAKKAYYQNEIKADSLLLESLTRNPDSLERLARERYMMKKDHEEIFIVVKESPED